MSLFISKENQELLWHVMNNSTKFREYVPNKESWFKETIRQFYDETSGKILDKDEVKELNRTVIRHMLQELAKIPVSANLETIQLAEPIPMMNIPVLSGPSREPKAPIPNAMLDDYANMYKPKQPDNIDFTEKEVDEPILNMEELIKSQVAARELELAKYAPPPPQKPIKIDNEIDKTIVLEESRQVTWETPTLV